jgi:TRAP-type mannitol/chloroaromatic compound transport system permease large subunit
VALYTLYVLGRAWLIPTDAPAAEAGPRVSGREIARAVAPPIILIVAVLGAILGGVATPTEAAAVGAVGALFMADIRQNGARRLTLLGGAALLLLAVAADLAPVRLQRSDAGGLDMALGAAYAGLAALGGAALLGAVWRARRSGLLTATVTQTMTVTAMIFATILTASLFSLVFVGLGGEARIEAILTAMPGGATGALIFSMALIFVLGFFLDFVEITVILLPLIAPMLILMGHDPMQLAILIAINLQTSFLTPPFGFSLFYLRGAAPKEVTTGMIYQGVIPFIGLQILGIGLVWAWPAIATWAPRALY